MIPEPSASVHLEKDDTYLPEVWTWFAAGVLVLALRLFVRTRTVGFRGLQLDDYWTLLFAAFWTINAVIVEVTYYTGGNVDVTPDEALALSAHDEWVLKYGSKWEFASWYTYSGCIWVLKFQVLCFYNRLNLDLIATRSVKIIFVITGLAYLALALTISLSCWPYHYNWQIKPLPGPDCTFRPQNFWTVVVLNVLTDAAILSIPTPVLWRLRISWPRKAGVSMLLLSGLFMMATAIVRAVQTLTGAPSVININRWGFRETGVGMIAVNAATLLPLFTERFWRRGGYTPHQHQHHNHHSVPPGVPPGPTERNRRPSGGSLVTKWNAALWWTRSVISSSGSRTLASVGAGTGAGGGRAHISSRHGGVLRSDGQLTVASGTEDRDLELGVPLGAVGRPELLSTQEEPRDEDGKKGREISVGITPLTWTVSSQEVLPVREPEQQSREESAAGPSAQVHDGGDLASRSLHVLPA